MPTSLPLQALTIFLIKEGKHDSSILPDIKKLNHIAFAVDNQSYDLYAKRSVAREPKWAEFFPSSVDRSKLGMSSSPGAVLLTTVDDRRYALTFGTGRYLLEDDCREDRFGLRVVLNSVTTVRSIEKDSFDSIHGKTRTQASKDFPIGLFGIDVERDLLKAVTGVPIIKELGSRLSGIDGLSALAPVEIKSLPEYLRKLYIQSTLETYKKGDFAFVDQIRSVTNRTIIDELDQVLVGKLKQRPFDEDGIELILPDVLDFSDVEYFRYKHKPHNPENLAQISIQTFLTTAENESWNLSVDTLKSRYVYSTHANDEVRTVGKVYRCLLAEIEHGKKNYVLSDGNWYAVGSDYLGKVNDFVGSADRYPVTLPVFKHDGGEGEYNIHVKDNVAGFYCFDKQLLHPERGQKFEFCDLYSEQHGAKDVVHVKIGKSSAALSHLFSQGTISAETFLEFPAVREQLNRDLLPPALRIADPLTRINAQDYRIVFAIIRKKDSRLPFFARVNLRQAFRMLYKWNFRPVLAEIDIDPAWLLTKNVTKPKPKGKKK